VSHSADNGKIRLFDLQKFSLYTCSEKIEVDILTPSLVSEAQVIQR